jgi:HEPN domain-containing protein
MDGIAKIMKEKEVTSYWTKSSDRDYQVMIDLFEKGHYTWSLFIGHLVLEKLLKAIYSQKFAQNPPLIHDLLRLAEKSNLDLDEGGKGYS